MYNKTSVEVWQNSLLELKEESFFDMMRLYLGEIKTPYNKQRLISSLASFIRTEANYKNIISFLDDFDIKVISAVGLIPNITEEVLIEFFSSEYSVSDILFEISNLKERLILFTQKEEYSSKKYLRINPFLGDELETFVKIQNLLEVEPVVYYSMEDNFVVSVEFIGALVSYIKDRGCSFKNDGTLKSGDKKRLAEIFKDKAENAELLITAMFNLGLITEGEKSLYVDEYRFELFAKQPLHHQLSLLCAASCSRHSQEGLKKETQLLLNILSSVPKAGYSLASIIKLAYFTSASSTSAAGGKSRFSQMLAAAAAENNVAFENKASIIERMLESAIKFGLLQKLGRSEKNVEIFTTGSVFTDRQNFMENGDRPPVLHIDSTFTVTVMPGLSLSQFLPLTSFISIKNWGIVSEFEISRQSITNSFDSGWTPDSIFEELSKYTNFEFPQNLKMSVEDWYNSYLSARIYHGYVLKVTEQNIVLVENNPRIQKYIKEKLAEGIYLLNVPAGSDILPFIKESGLDFMGKINNPETSFEHLGFPMLKDGSPLNLDETQEPVKINLSQANELISKLKAKVQEMDIPDNQKESLEYRIRNRLILTEDQLAKTFVRVEIFEADGMDYSGKIFLLDAAAKKGDTVEVTIPDYNKNDTFITLVGVPLAVIKQPSDAVIRFQTIPDGLMQNLVASRISRVRRIRF